MRFLVPQGIGDSIWALFKAQDIAAKLGDGVVELRVAVWNPTAVAETRAIEFLRRFACVKSVEPYEMPREDAEGQPLAGAVSLPGPVADEDGYYRYLPDGPTEVYPDIDYVLMPNAPLERGITLDEWLPEFKADWNLMDQFYWTDEEWQHAQELPWRLDPFGGSYSVFFMGSLGSNTTSGHNRGGLWSMRDWFALGENLHQERGHQIVVVGASYDLDYMAEFIGLIEGRKHWHNRVGVYSIGRTLATCRSSRLVVSYQSGIGIVSHYLGKQTAVFWRPKGNSISPDQYVSFDERMASAWADPKYRQNLLPAIYGQHTPDDIFNWYVRNA